MKRFAFLQLAVPLWISAAVLPEPGMIFNPREDLLAGADWKCEKTSSANAAAGKYYHFSAQAQPVNWRMVLTGNPKNSAGSLSFENNICRLVQKKNLWNGCYLTLKTPRPAQKLRQSPHAPGIWAKGEGTLTLEVVELKGKKPLKSRKYRWLVTDKWHFYRGKTLTQLHPETETFKINISVYGDIRFSKAELSPETAVDPSAEMVFYVPFDKGSGQALFSRGPAGVFGESEPAGRVPGLAGEALRLDSRRRLTPLGMLRLPMGLQYIHPGKALPREEGTLEFYFKPLPELAADKKWSRSPLFSIGTSTWMWPDSEDFTLQFIKTGSKLRLEYKEHIRLQTYPERTPVKISGNPASERKGSFLIDPQQGRFMQKWHHLAFTWNSRSRKIYLDGREIIKIDAVKEPCISAPSPSLYLGCISLNQPFTSSCDIDELKIFKGLRYRKNFTPRVEIPAFKKITKREKISVPSPEDTFSFNWKKGKENYQLRVAVFDGAPLIYSSRQAAGNVTAEHDPELPRLRMQKLSRTTALLPRRDVRMTCTFKEEKDRLLCSVTLEKGAAGERVYLEPRITLHNQSGFWHTGYDGFTSRPLLTPFRSFAYSDLQTALPLAGAWNDHSGAALALAPHVLTSFLSRGMESPETLDLKLRTVLDSGNKITWDFEVFSFAPRWGEAALVDRYHALHPRFFSFSGTDPRISGNAAQTNIWNSSHYRQRRHRFSLSEISRRIRGRWCWYYWTGAATGNWSADPELLKEFAPLNEIRTGDLFYHSFFRKKVAAELDAIRATGITPALYISSWAEKRLVPAYRDSLVEPEETPNGINHWKNYWTRGVTDYIMLPSGVRYGSFLRRQTANMLTRYTGMNSFAHDLFGGDHYFRKETSLGGLRAFDEKGSYTHNLPAMGLFVNDLKNMKKNSPFRTALISNGHAQIGSFNTFFRTDNNIHERPLTWALQDWGNLQQHSRFMGEKPTTFFNMPSMLGNYIHGDGDSLELIRYALIVQQHTQLLAGMLFNINQNWSVLGVRESIPMIDQLLDVHALGHRQAAAFTGSAKLAKVRYGEAERGALVLVNLSPESRSSSLAPDHGYLGATPLLCAENQVLHVRDSRVKTLTVAPLSWQIIEMAAATDSKELSYDSALSKIRSGRKMDFTFRKQANINRLAARLSPREKLLSVTLNGQKLTCRMEKGKLYLSSLLLKEGDVLSIVTGDLFWHISPSVLKDISFKQGKIRCSSAFQACGQRIKEFFRFWGVNQTPEQTFDLQLTDKEEKQILIELKKAAVPGIFQKGSRLILAGKDRREMMDVVEEFLKALESSYPYTGYFGNQMPVYPWDHATTTEQRKLIRRSGLILKPQSTQKAAENFRNWLNKNKIDPSDGF